MREDGGGKRGPGGQGQLGGGDCKDFGGIWGGVPLLSPPLSRRTTLARKQRFNRPHPANFRLCRIFQKPQSFQVRKVFKNRIVSAAAKSSKTANFSFLCGAPQTFHFSAEPPHSFGRRKVFKNRKLFISLRYRKLFISLRSHRKLFISLRYRKLFSRRQAGLGPPGSSLWPVARAGSE